MPDPPLPLRSIDLLSRDDSRLLIVDMQEKLLRVIPQAEQITSNCQKLIRAARILGPPVFSTEQYPKGLGKTTPELAAELADPAVKLRFSCSQAVGWGTAAEPSDSDLQDRHKVVVAGIEAHVCVLQTAFDLMAAGFQVYVPADAVGSRHELDWKIALDRLAGGGAVITTTEAVLFEWCEAAGTDEFKQISRLVTDR
jgi:isochorismate hydrolase